MCQIRSAPSLRRYHPRKPRGQNKFAHSLSNLQARDCDWQLLRQGYRRSASPDRCRNHPPPEKHVMADPTYKRDNVLPVLWKRAVAECRDTSAVNRSDARTDFLFAIKHGFGKLAAVFLDPHCS